MVATVTLRPRRDDDDERIVMIHSGLNADLPAATVEEFRYEQAVIPPSAQRRWMVAERDGRVVGSSLVMRQLYSSEADALIVHISVDPEQQRQGIGALLYGGAMDEVRRLGGRVLYAHIRDERPDAEHFAFSRGFEPTGHGDQMSVLDVPRANLAPSERAARRVAASGIRIATLTDLGMSEAILRQIWQLDNETSPDVPGEEDWSGMPYDEWRAFFIERPLFNPDAFWFTLDGDEIIGMAFLEPREDPSVANTGYTAVRRKYRGRGIARALKYTQLTWAQDRGIQRIFTGNDVENKPMLAVNVDLGFRPLPRAIELTKKL